jgi:bacterioferritin
MNPKLLHNSNIVELLQAAYIAELQTVEDYLANSVWLDGPGSRQIAESLDVYIAQELAHAKRIAIRLKELGVRSPDAFRKEAQRILPLHDETDPLIAVEGVLEAERNAIVRYEKLIEACEGKDIITQDLIIAILADEEKHRKVFEDFLNMLSEERKTKSVSL